MLNVMKLRALWRTLGAKYSIMNALETVYFFMIEKSKLILSYVTNINLLVLTARGGAMGVDMPSLAPNKVSSFFHGLSL